MVESCSTSCATNTNIESSSGEKCTSIKDVEKESNDRKIKVSIGLLIYMNFLQFVYRYTAVGVMKTLGEYFTMDNKDIGMLQTSYLCATVLLTPLCGYFGDRYSRKWILVFSMSIWAIGIGSSLLCKREHFILFLALRVLVAVGDGVYGVIAPIVISDMFPIEKRSIYLMIFFFTIPVGSGFGLICGGRVYVWTGSWQAATGFPSVLGLWGIILMILFMYEPKRGAFENAKQEVSSGTFWQDIIYLFKIKSLTLLNFSIAGSLFTLGSLSWWAPQYIAYGYAMSTNQTEVTKEIIGEVSLVVGAISGISGIIGVFAGTMIAKAWRNGKLCFRNCATIKADAFVCCISMFIASPIILLCFLIAHKGILVAYLLLNITSILVSVNWAIDVDMTMLVIVPSKRSSAMSLQLLIARLFGDTFAPYIVGSISEVLKGTSSLEQKYYSLQYALYLPCGTLLVASLLYGAMTFTLKEDRKRCLEKIELENSTRAEHVN